MKKDKKILVCTHGGWIMEFMNTIRGMMGSDVIGTNNCKNTSLYVIKFTKEGKVYKPKVLIENDNSHLTENIPTQESAKVSSETNAKVFN
jgi:broad specificity phosphatase PhoE